MTSSHTDMIAIGYYDTDGNYSPYATGPQKVYPFGDSLHDEDGFRVAVKDEYGDWVNPRMKKLGIKSRIEIRSDEVTP